MHLSYTDSSGDLSGCSLAGLQSNDFKIAILRAINAGFPGCLLRKSHTERFGKSRATEIRILDGYLPLHKNRVLC